MASRLEADSIYHPIKGMNPDSNGISTSVNECLLAENVDILPSHVRVRKGTKVFGELVQDMTVADTTYDSGSFNDTYSTDGFSREYIKFVADNNEDLTLEWLPAFQVTNSTDSSVTALQGDILWTDSGLTENEETVYYAANDQYALWYTGYFWWVTGVLDVGDLTVSPLFSDRDQDPTHDELLDSAISSGIEGTLVEYNVTTSLTAVASTISGTLT